MNDADVASIFERFEAAWPFMQITDAQLDAWLDTLSDVEVADARAVVEKAIRTQDRPPSIAWFLGEVRNEVERRALGAKRRDELPAAADPGAKAKAMALIAGLAANSKPHDHRKGWQHCPTCVAAVERDHQHLAEGCHICMSRRAEIGPPLPLPTSMEDA